MESSVDVKTAAICGLFCQTCPQYPVDCGGCLSAKPAAHCRDCRHGFRVCARKNGITRCFECSSFPCERLESFKHIHVVNGISHHAGVVADLQDMKDCGVAQWVARKQAENRCPNCGQLIIWYEKYTHACGA